MALLTGAAMGGEASYGNFIFPGSCETTDLRITPVPDRAGRTFVGHRFSLTLSFYITSTTTTSPAVLLAIQELTQPAQRLVYSGRGVGNIFINFGALGHTDIRWGPIPKAVVLKPRGTAKAVQVIWTVEWEQTTCGDGVEFGQPMEFVYTLGTDIDQSGYTKRTYTATLRIPQTRQAAGDRRIRMTADQFRESITPPLLTGFRRIPGTVTINEDKCELRCIVIDEQMPPNIPPEGVIEAEASHRIASEPGKYGTMWTATLEASYEVMNGVPVNAAYDAFFALARDRIGGRGLDLIGKAIAAKAKEVGKAKFGAAEGVDLFFRVQIAAGLGIWGNTIVDAAKEALGGGGGKAGAGGGDGKTIANSRPTILPWTFTAAEPQIYGKTRVNLSLTYKIISADLGYILTKSGLWRPVPLLNGALDATQIAGAIGRGFAGGIAAGIAGGITAGLAAGVAGAAAVANSAWGKWSASIRFATGPRGIANLTFDPGEDKIVDLCLPTAVTIPTTPKHKSKNPPPPGAVPQPGSDVAGLGGSRNPFDIFPEPDRATSYIHYQADLTLEGDQGAVIANTLPTASVSTSTVKSGTAGETFVQQRTSPTIYIVLTGSCVRAGFPIPTPVVTSINGSTPILCNREGMGEGFKQAVVGTVGNGIPIYAATWRNRYVLTDVNDGDLPVPANDLLS